jgi:hypothetical protein
VFVRASGSPGDRMAEVATLEPRPHYISMEKRSFFFSSSDNFHAEGAFARETFDRAPLAARPSASRTPSDDPVCMIIKNRSAIA